MIDGNLSMANNIVNANQHDFEPKPEIKDVIISLVCQKHNLTFEQLKTKSRRVEYTIPRHIILFLIHELTEYGKHTNRRKIAPILGLTHSTLYNSLKYCNNMICTDTKFSSMINELKIEINEVVR